MRVCESVGTLLDFIQCYHFHVLNTKINHGSRALVRGLCV